MMNPGTQSFTVSLLVCFSQEALNEINLRFEDSFKHYGQLVWCEPKISSVLCNVHLCTTYLSYCHYLPVVTLPLRF